MADTTEIASEEHRKRIYDLGMDNLLAHIAEHADIVRRGKDVRDQPPYAELKSYLHRAWRRAKIEGVAADQVPSQVREWMYDQLTTMVDAAIEAQMQSQGRRRAEFIYDPEDLPSLEPLTHPSP